MTQIYSVDEVERPPQDAFWDFWSAPVVTMRLAAAGGDIAFGAGANITLAVPAGVTWLRVIVLFNSRIIENAAAVANAIDHANSFIQVQKVAGGAWTNAITVTNNMFPVAANSIEGGTVLMGNLDVIAEVDDNVAYEFQWEDGEVDADFLDFHDVQMGIRVYFER